MGFRWLFGALSPAGSRGRLSVMIFHRVLPRPDPLFPGEIDAPRFDALLERLKRWFNIIPLADGRGFLALDAGKGVADLEIAVIDRLDAKGLTAAEKSALQFLRQQLRQWRQEGTEFESRAIIVAKRPQSPVRGRALSPLTTARDRDGA